MAKGPKSKAEVYRNMSAIRSRDNQTEIALRRALHARGLRFRLHPKDLIGKPDIVFRRERVAIFVDGDFWHARRLREEGLASLARLENSANRDYWTQKFTRRIVRDDEVSASLTYQGWIVLRYWEADLRKDVNRTADLIEKAVLKRR